MTSYTIERTQRVLHISFRRARYIPWSVPAFRAPIFYKNRNLKMHFKPLFIHVNNKDKFNCLFENLWSQQKRQRPEIFPDPSWATSPLVATGYSLLLI